MSGAKAKPDTVPVWDLFVRLFHWALVLGVVVTAGTGFLAGARFIDIHIWVGTSIAALVLLRLVWGFLGSGFARFSQFLTGPRTTLRHLGSLFAHESHRHLGHNPLGGWMIVALLAVVLSLTATGALVLGGVFHAGPFKALLSVATGQSILGLHEVLAFALLGLIALHLGGVVYESRRSHENLARAMLTGRKDARDGDPPLPVLRAHPVLAVLTGTAGLAAVALLALPQTRATVPDGPVDMTGSAYAKECVDCHIAFHPSLLPADSWQQLMATLDDHFGEDASLPDEKVLSLTVWLVEHAAERTDTKPATLLRRVKAEAPFAITESPAWTRTHDDLNEATFKTAPVFSKSNCAACHADAAQGWFYPGAIDIPEPPATPANSTGDTDE